MIAKLNLMLAVAALGAWLLTVPVWGETNVAPAEATPTPAPAPAAAPALDEVTEAIRALRANYVDREQLDDARLNAASLAGILNAVGQGAELLSPSAHGMTVSGRAALETSVPPGTEPLARTEIIEPDIGYLHVMEVGASLVGRLDAELKKFEDSKVSGYVLDLRYAGGDDYTAAATVASRFLTDGQELFRVKEATGADQVFRANGASAPVRVTTAPLLLLVNAHTRGSAEALVGALRAQDRGIVLGSLTAGSAVAWKDVPLQDGHVLRMASSKVVLQPANPKSVVTAEVFPGGIPPDIYVQIDPTTEHDVLYNPETNVTLTVSLQPTTSKPRRSEAELLKAFRGESLELGSPKPSGPNGEKSDETEEEIQRVRDVVLQRAVDILKGIRVLLSWQ